MSKFIYAHSGDADWKNALASCLEQIERADAPAPNLGWCYLTDYFTQAASDILSALRARLPGVHFVGTVGVGVGAEAVEYFDAPGLAIMLADLPAEAFALFSSLEALDGTPEGFEPFTALVHASGGTPDLQAKLEAASAKLTTGYQFGGLSSARNKALCIADEVLAGGFTGVAFGPQATVFSRVTQGCQPIGPLRTVTRAQGNYLVTLDEKRALDCVLEDMGHTLEIEDAALRLELAQTLAGLVATGEDVSPKPGQFGTNTEVRHIVGVGRKGGLLMIAEQIKDGMRLAFCKRNAEAAKHDLLRIVAEVRAQAEAAGGMRGALYISCSGRGGPHFGEPNAEFRMVHEALGGETPLIGFFAGGEIARHHLYGYTGVLTVFAGA